MNPLPQQPLCDRIQCLERQKRVCCFRENFRDCEKYDLNDHRSPTIEHLKEEDIRRYRRNGTL